MVRSGFAITRFLVLPYAVLLALYLIVVGGGGVVLYYQVRAVETRLLVSEMTAATEPLAKRLRATDSMGAMREGADWLVADIERLFTSIPTLRTVSLRGGHSAYAMVHDRTGISSAGLVSQLPAGALRAEARLSPEQRLHGEAGELFLLQYDMAGPDDPLVRLEFAFERAALLARVNEGLAAIKRAVLFFGIVGALSILIALVISGVAVRATRLLESHFQTIYQRASLTETAAKLVHDLRNPLAALRANTKALLLSPEQAKAIAPELDRDIVTLNDKLRVFLDLTRQRDETLTPVDIRELIDDAVRLAAPALAEYGLSVETAIAPGLPQVMWQQLSMCDALVNLILNAGQSGQRHGSIRITAQARDGALEITVEDRGRGISKVQMPRLFDAFYTTREEGHGLGLAIVKRIVSDHQGQIYAENRQGGGAKFVLTLPLQRKEEHRWTTSMKKHFPA